jgi:hypothetical protein
LRRWRLGRRIDIDVVGRGTPADRAELCSRPQVMAECVSW